MSRARLAAALLLALVAPAGAADGPAIPTLAIGAPAPDFDLAGIDGRKGSIAVGKDADLVVWDPDASFVVDETLLHQRHKQTPYAGFTLRGRVIETYAKGRLVYGVPEERGRSSTKEQGRG